MVDGSHRGVEQGFRARALRYFDWIIAARAYVDRLVHRSAKADPLAEARHRALIASQLAAGVAAAASLPAYLAFRGTLSPVEAVIFSVLTAPILIALFLSRTGRFEAAHLMITALHCTLAGLVACVTGGLASFAAIWLVVGPIEATLS